MNSQNGLIAFLKTFFPTGTVEIRKHPSRDADSITLAKSDDKVIILNEKISVNWYYVQHEKSGLKGWIPAQKLLILKETTSKTLANFCDSPKVEAIYPSDSLESIRAFNRSCTLLWGINFMPKYFYRK